MRKHSFAMGSPSPLLHFSLPDAELFKFPPRSDLFPPRPTGEGRSAWDRPFDIPQLLFDYTTEIGFPFCVVFIYIVTSSIFNHVNTTRKFRPWGLSQTGFFHHLVLLHNIALALFSGWMFFGFCKSVVISLPSKQSSHFLVTTADALCKITGDRGLGRGHTRIHRSPASAPNSFGIASVGDRMWHQGLGYFGWIFYVSKVYELVDTVLIITMGKKCSFLQRYHHAGVMLCAWANFRYMVPAYIIPCLLNSFIHTLMVCIVSALFQGPELTQVSSVFLLRFGHTGCACAFLYQEMPYGHADHTIPCRDCAYMDLLFSRLRHSSGYWL